MKILKAGTKVKTIIGNIEAFIVGVMITEETIDYKIRYFAGGEEKIAWLYRYEIELIEKRKPAGFGNNTEETDESKLIEVKAKE